MTKERKNNSIIIGVLIAIIVVMSLGFAAISERFTLTSEATISQTWNVQITGITKKASSTGATETELKYTSTTAVFNVSLAQPGDYAEYTVTVSNQGGINAVLTDLSQSLTGDDAISYTVTPAVGSEKGSTLEGNGGTHTFDVRVEYLSSAIGENAPSANASRSLSLILDYDQE